MTDDAARVHPEGAPGIAEQMHRRLLGDSSYEASVQHADDMRRVAYLKAVDEGLEQQGRAAAWLVARFLVFGGFGIQVAVIVLLLTWAATLP